MTIQLKRVSERYPQLYRISKGLKGRNAMEYIRPVMEVLEMDESENIVTTSCIVAYEPGSCGEGDNDTPGF